LCVQFSIALLPVNSHELFEVAATHFTVGTAATNHVLARSLLPLVCSEQFHMLLRVLATRYSSVFTRRTHKRDSCSDPGI